MTDDRAAALGRAEIHPEAGGVVNDQTPDPVADVWELLWTAACDHRDANPPPHNSTSRLIDALMPIVQAYGDAREATGRAEGYREAVEKSRWICARSGGCI